MLLSVIRLDIEGSEVWEGNKGHAGSLEYIILDGAKRIYGCSSKTCNEVVRGYIYRLFPCVISSSHSPLSLSKDLKR